MNKTLAALLGISLAANILLVWQRASTPAGRSDLVRPPAVSTGDGTALAPTESRRYLKELATAAPAKLRDELRAAGWPEAHIRSVLLACLKAKYGADKPAPTPPWWRAKSHSRDALRKEDQAKELLEKIDKEAASLLGEHPDSTNLEGDDKLGMIPGDKKEAIRQIEKDYQALSRKIGWSGVADMEAQRKLEEEKLHDLEGLLTPDQIREYLLHNSRVADQVRGDMSGFDATEAEYRAVYELASKFDDKYGFLRFKGTYDEMQKGMQDMADAVLRVLGNEHGMEYIWGNDGEYQGIREVAQAGLISPDVPAKIMQIRSEVGREAMACSNDKNLSDEKKMEALRALADRTQARISALVPAEAAARSNHTLFNWVEELRSGRVYVFNPMNRGTVIMNINTAAPPKG